MLTEAHYSQHDTLFDQMKNKSLKLYDQQVIPNPPLHYRIKQ